MIQLTCIAYAPDGSLLAMGGQGGVTLYNALTKLPYRALPTASYWVNSVAFSPDGNTVAVGEGNGQSGYVELFNVETGKLSASYKTAANAVASVVFSKKGTFLAVGGEFENATSTRSVGVVELWNVFADKRTLSIKTTATSVSSVALSPDDRTVAVGGSNPQGALLELWNTANGSLFSEVIGSQPGHISSVTFTPDGKTVAASTNLSGSSTVRLWTIATGALVASVPTQLTEVDNLAISPDGTQLIDAGANSSPGPMGQSASSGASELWNISGPPKIVWNNVGGWDLIGVAFSPDGSTIAEVGTQDTLYALGMEEDFIPTAGFFDLISTSIEYSATSVVMAQSQYWPGPVDICYPAFSGDGKLVAGGGFDVLSGQASINVWDSQNGTLVSTFPSTVLSGVAEVAFSSSSQLIAVVSGGYVKIWNIQSGECVQTIIPGLTGAFAFSPDGKLFAVAGTINDQTFLGIWSVATGERVGTITVAVNEWFSFAFSPDSSTIATGGTDLPSGSNQVARAVLQLWNASTGELNSTFNTLQSEVSGVAFSPDGTTVAAACYFQASATAPFIGSIQLWNVGKNALVTSIPVPNDLGSILALSYVTNGKTLFAISSSGLMEFDPLSYAMKGYVSGQDTLYFALSPDGSKVAVAGPPGTLSISKVPAVSSIPIDRLVFANNIVGGNSTTGTLSLTEPAPSGGVVVGLGSTASYPTYIAIPTSVTIPAGKKTVTFQIACAVRDTATEINVTAYCGAYTKTATLTVLPRNLSSISLSQASIVGGNPLFATVRIEGIAGFYGAGVTINNSSLVATMTSYVLVDSGQSSSNFNIFTNPVTTPQVVTLIAKGGDVTKAVSFTVLPVGVKAISLSSTSVKPGSSSTATVTLNAPAGANGVVVNLTSSDPSATIPASITIPAGLTAGTVTITTKAGTAKSTAIITATTGTLKASVKLTIT